MDVCVMGIYGESRDVVVDCHDQVRCQIIQSS